MNSWSQSNFRLTVNAVTTHLAANFADGHVRHDSVVVNTANGHNKDVWPVVFTLHE